MTDLVPHEYAGITFRVAPGLSRDKADDYCADLLAYTSSFKAGKSQSPSKPQNNNNESTPKRASVKPLEAVLDPVETILADTYYLSGYYRTPCRLCGEPIKRTGTRGRAPVMHKECR
jgi:hypothetical protein